MFPDTPIVFCGINNLNKSRFEKHKMFIGINQEVNSKSTIELVLSLLPNTERFLVISDRTSGGIKTSEKFTKDVQELDRPDLKFQLIDDYTIPELKNHIQALGANDVVLVLRIQKIKGIGKRSPLEFAKIITDTAKVPVFNIWRLEVHAFVGGVYVLPVDQGKLAAKIGLRIIEGENVQSIQKVFSCPITPMLDYTLLKKFNINTDNIPPGTTLINQPPPLLEKYENLTRLLFIIAVLFVFTTCSFVIILFIKRKGAKLIAKSEQRFKAIYENAPVLIDAFDRDGRCVLWNNECQKVFGWTIEEINAHADTLALFYPDPTVRNEVVQSVTAKPDANFKEWRPKTKDGKTLITRWANFRLPDGLTFNLGYDITQRKKDEEQLKEALDAAKKASQSKSNFLANMSHEIRTPLNGLMGMLQLLYTTHLDPEQEELTDQALCASERLTRLLTDILDMSRIEAGRMELAIDPFDFSKAILSVADLFRPSAEQKNISIHASISPDIPKFVLGDIHRFQQVLSNLVGNAVKFTDSGDIDIEAHPLPAESEGLSNIFIVIADTGVGISEESRKQLFHPFTQGDEGYKKRFQGAGLGLTISKEIVNMMGGTLSVKSELGVGSEFYLCIPFQPASALSVTFPQAETIAPRVGSILVVEDDEASSFAMCKMLKNLGHSVTAAEDGETALNVLTRNEFDLIFMDVQLPVMDGIEATKAIRDGRTGDKNRNLPIVAMTAYAMQGDKEKFLASGMNGYLSKPLARDALTKELGRHL